jgi:hypothetical protein
MTLVALFGRSRCGQWKSVYGGKSGLYADIALTAVRDPKQKSAALDQLQR